MRVVWYEILGSVLILYAPLQMVEGGFRTLNFEMALMADALPVLERDILLRCRCIAAVLRMSLEPVEELCRNDFGFKMEQFCDAFDQTVQIPVHRIFLLLGESLNF